MPTPPPNAPMSQVIMLRLQALPRLTVPAAVLVLALVGLAAPPLYAVPALGILLALLAFLATFTWAHADRRGRVLRMIAMGVLAGLLVSRAFEALS
ncbi:DUF6703 family protein [Solicola sp. PLA-1-18]|uniref:DUF6703 family protein n=1 Tax=Solicola sp. PLA-1-18 TaxID=3380532 RepID=UPI003B80422A